MFMRQLAFSGFAALVVAGWTVLVGGCIDSGPEQRVLTRGAISGRVMLVDAPGLNDLSRVRVDFGNGEGGVAVAEDGLFAVTDLEPDVYTLTVTYAGGLTAEANGSAYQTFSRRVPLGSGATVDVGELALQLATGRISGLVEASDAQGAVVVPAGTARLVRATGGDERSVDVNATGAFTFEDVPVGVYAVQIDRQDFAVPDGGAVDADEAAACGAPVTIAQGDDDVRTPPLRQVKARPGLVPGAADLSSTNAGTWWVRPGVAVLSPTVPVGFAAVARVWLGNINEPPEFAPARDDLRLAIPEGRHRLFVQVGDRCRYQSDVLEIPVVRDESAPTLIAVDVAGANSGDDDDIVISPLGGVLPVIVDASDDVAGVAGIAVALLADGAAPNDDDLAALDFEPLDPAMAVRPVVDVALPGGDGRWTVLARVRDAVGNLSEPRTRIITVDTARPVVRAVVIGDGTGVTTTADVALRFEVSGAAEMRVGLAPGLNGVPWQPFRSDTRVTLPPRDGTTIVYTRFRDLAGNETDEIGTAVSLDTKGSLLGRVFVEGRADNSVAEVRLLGTSLVAPVDTAGDYAFHDVPAGIYTIEAFVSPADPQVDGFLVAQTGIAVQPRQTSAAPELFVSRKRGGVGGQLLLETLTAESGHAGALVELVEAGIATTTGQDGFFAFSGVLTGTYTLRAQKPGYQTTTLNSVVVEHQRTSTVTFDRPLQLLRGQIELRALLEDGPPSPLVQVVLTGPTPRDGFAGDDGSIAFSDLLPGAYTLRLRGTGAVQSRYRVQTRTIRVTGGEVTVVGDVVLDLARGALAGVASTERDGGIGTAPGVLIEVDGGPSIVSGVDGRFTLQGLIAGTTSVRLSQADHAAVTLNSVAIVDGQTTTLSPPPLLRLRGGVRGRVFLDGGDSPTVVQASLQGETGSARADASGTFALDGILPGNHVLVIETTGAATGAYDTLTQPITVVGGQRIELPSTTLARARGSIALAVRLEDEADFGGVVVELTGAGLTGISDALGNVRIDAVPVGTYNLRLSKTNFTARELTGIAVSARATTTLLPVGMVLNRGVVTGKVIFDDDTDFAGITVSLLGSDVTATTDALGDFVLTGVKPGTWNVIAQATSYNSARDNGLFVGPGQAIDVGLLTLTRKRGAVVGRVSVEGAVDASGVTVELLNAGFRTLPQLNGDFSFSIPVGNYDGVVARKEFFATAIDREVITVTDVGNYTVAPVTLRGQSGILQGVVSLADAAIGDEGGSTVTLEGLPGSATDGVVVRATTLADGSYAFDQPEDFAVVTSGAFALTGAVFPFRGVPIGAYRLTAREPVDAAAGRDIVIRDVVIATAQTTTENVELRKVFIAINGGAAFTTNRLVTLTLGATDCFRMRLSVDAAPAPGQAFVACSSPVANFSLGSSDGVHTVFAEFMNSAAELLPVVAASILVDTTANIATFTHNVPAGTKKTLGDTVSFAASTGEAGGRAVVNLSGYDSAIVLSDQGGGNYGTTYLLKNRIDIQPTSNTASTGPGVVTLTFTDRFGNVATANANTTTTAGTKSTTQTPMAIGVPPIVSSIQIIPDLLAQTARVTFTTDETATSVVRVGQAEASLCATGCATTTAGTSHTVTVTGTQAGEAGGLFLRNKRYFVRIEATDTKTNLSVGAVLSFFLQPDAPKMVVPIPMDSRVLVRWEAPPQEDLAGFFVERSENGGAFVRISGATPYNHEVLTFDDRTVVNGRSYVYRVRAMDFFGNASESATTTDMAKNADGTFDATKLAAFSACGTATPAAATSTAGTDVSAGVLPLCNVWTLAGSPFRVNGSIAVPTGGILIVGPSVALRVATNSQIVVQGRLGVYGGRGHALEVANSLFGDIDPLISSGVPQEDQIDLVRFSPQSAVGSWNGIFIRNSVTLGSGRLSVRGYSSGDVVYRASLAGAALSLIDSDSRPYIIRSSIDLSNRVAVVSGPSSVLLGVHVRRFAPGSQNEHPGLLPPRSEQVDGIVDSGSDHSSDQIKRGSVVRFGRDPCFRPALFIDDSVEMNTTDSFPCGDVSLRSIDSKVLAFSNLSAPLISYGSSVSQYNNDNSHKMFSGILQLMGSEVVSAGETFKASRITGRLSVNSVTSAGVMRGSTFVNPGCALLTRIVADFSFGVSAALAALAVECTEVNDGNIRTIIDFRDDVTRGVLNLDTSITGSFPRPMVDGPQIVNLPAVKRGVTLRIYGDDLEDGPLPSSAGYWTNAVGARIGDGPMLTLPTTLPVGTTIFTAHVVDADGLDSDIPWPVEVLNDAARADSWMWPDRDRWRVAALRFDQLPPKTNATDAGTFVWRCFTPGCTTTCAFDPDPNADIASVANAPCRSPVEVAGLSAGSHTLVVQPRDAAGNAIDLPQRYTWTVNAGPHPAPAIRVTAGTNGDATVEMLSDDSATRVVTCSVDGRHEIPCGAGLNISGANANGEVAHELLLRVRARADGREIFSPRTLRLNDPDDVDGDGWIDSDDPCLTGAEIGAACADPDGDGVLDPNDVCPIGDLTRPAFTAVAAGGAHVCALHANGGVYCAGLNTAGQLGDGTFTNRTSPVRVVRLGPPFTARVASVDAGSSHTCAALADGTARCWGENDNGRLGDGDLIGNISRETPVVVTGLTNAKKVTLGADFSCALLTDGTVKCWGSNNTSNQLGDGTSTNRATPVSVVNLSGAVDVGAGGSHACAVLASGGVRCWGENDNGRLGDGNTGGNINRSSSVVVTGLSDAIAVDSGGAQSCALRANGALSCWGANNLGQLGIGTTVDNAVPVAVLASGASALSSSFDGSVCGVVGGALSCWGLNNQGQFGNGTTTSSLTPILIAATTGVRGVAASNGFTCVVDASNRIRCWGRNAEGQLGVGTTTATTTVPTSGEGAWTVEFVRGPLAADVDGDGCEDP